MSSNDKRGVHVKPVRINGKTHFVTVCPPSDEVHDDMVWRFPRQDSAAQERIYAYDGIGSITEYILTKADQFSEIHGMLY